MRVRRWIAVALALASCSAPPRPSPPPPDTTPPVVAADAADAAPAPKPAFELAGSYTNTHTVWMVCDSNPDGCDEEVEDRMTIARDGDALAVKIDLVQANAHTCTFEGTLARIQPTDGAETYAYTAKDGDDDHPCKLTLAVGPSELSLASEGCRYHCGARAYLDATFPYN